MKKINFKNVIFAASALQFQSSWTLVDIIQWCLTVLGYLVPLLIGAAVVVFLYGVLVFIFKASNGNAEGRADGIKFMVFGIIGITVMVSIWGLVAFVANTFGVSTAFVPQFPTSSGGISSPPPSSSFPIQALPTP